MNHQNLEERVEQLETRNRSVDAEKAWETSLLRRSCIAILTYLFIVGYLYLIDVNRPWINAIVPVLGFVLSTLSLSLVKKLWLGSR